MLNAGLTAHLGYEYGKHAPADQANRHKGPSAKMLKGQDGAPPISIPRNRDGSFELELVKQVQTRINGVDDKIIGLYAADRARPDQPCH
ncbi:transposase [Pseudorhodobacter aquimaris]|uniref:transposase n=1 Tax=Pseudorhodobacter aquimaris TaxID=687412 RepID=UPI000ABF94F1